MQNVMMRLLLGVVMSLMLANEAQTQTTAPTTHPALSNTRGASRMPHIEGKIYDTNQLEHDIPEILKEKAREVGWAQPIQWGPGQFGNSSGGYGGGNLISISFRMEPVYARSGTNLLATVEIPPDVDARGAREVLDSTVQELRALLKETFAARNQSILEEQATCDRTQREIRDLEERLDSIRLTVGNAVEGANGSSAAARAAIAKSGEQLQVLKLDLAGLNARSEAIGKAIAQYSDKIGQKVKDDPIAVELAKVVEFREERAKTLAALAASGSTPQEEVSAARAAVAEARARLLERQEAVSNRAGGDVVANWNRELMSLGIDQAEKEAKVRALEASRDRLVVASRDLERADALVLELAAARKRYGQQESNLNALRAGQRSAKEPTVTVTESKDW